MRNKTPKFLGSIRARMVAIYLPVTLIGMIAISFTVSAIVEGFLVSQRIQTQTEETKRLALEISPDVVGHEADKIYAYIGERAQSMDGRILILDTDAVVQADSASRQNGCHLPYREVRDVLVGGSEASYGYHRIARNADTGWVLGDQTVWCVYYTAPITSNGVYVGAVLFSALIQDVVDGVEKVVAQTTLVFVAVAIATAVLTFVFSRVITKPIERLTSAIRKMGKRGGNTVRGDAVRVDISGGSEIAELGSAFNRMSEQIADHDRVRDEFVSNASHELKTPLSTMKLLSESILYEENPDPKVMKEFFTDVNHEVDRLSRIITDLLRLVQDDAVEAELTLGDVRLDELVARVTERVRKLAEKKGIALTLTTQPVTVLGETLRLEQATINLIENAIKYTDAGSVNVSLSVEEDEAVFRVKDSGIGIPAEAIPHLFERFFRVDKARSRGTGGTGLGLAIVEKIVDMHNGTIEVESVLGQGSTFIVRLPVKSETGGEPS